MTNEKNNSFLLGAHMSIAGGLEKSIIQGASIGCTCIQIFTKSNKQWHARNITSAEAEIFKNTIKDFPDIQQIVVHAGYLINIGAPNNVVHAKSTASLQQELERCALLNIPYLVLHPGAAVTSSVDDCIKRIAETLNVLFENNIPVKILLENTAGQGTVIGHTFEQLAQIYNAIEKKAYLGFCFDTCHAFAAGYDFSTPATYAKMWHEFDKHIGLKNLHAIHLNNAKGKLGQRIDRHEHIEDGNIPLTAFTLLVNDPRFATIPKILETPKPDGILSDKKNMKAVYGLLGK